MYVNLEFLFALLVYLKRLAHEFPLREAQPPLQKKFSKRVDLTHSN